MTTQLPDTGIRAIGWTAVIILLVILGLAFLPLLFGFSRERRMICISQIRQLSTAVQMYAQDNGGQYPGKAWVSSIASYVGNSEEMFKDANIKESTFKNRGKVIDYGYSGLLVHPDGSGISNSRVLSPSEVGCIADVTPARAYLDGGLIGGGVLGTAAAVTPVARHGHGTVAGYCDGHAKYLPGGVNPRDLSSGVGRAFYHVSSFGLVENPVASLGAVPLAGQTYPSFQIGGEFVTAPFLRAAMALSLGGKEIGFAGQHATKERGANYAWGVADGRVPAGNAVAVARDVVLIVVAKSSKIPTIGPLTNAAYVKDSSGIRALFAGSRYVQNSIQVYTLPPTSGTRRFFTRVCGIRFGKEAVEVANDAEMIDKIANDPYGIGYCSSAFFDPDRVTQVAIANPTGTAYLYPQSAARTRWVIPKTPPVTPLTRTLYMQFSGNTWTPTGRSFGPDHFGPGAATLRELQAGPLFQAGYWKP